MAKKTGTSRRTSTVKKSTSSGKGKSKKATTRRRTSRKRKTKLPAYKTIVYCALGIAVCILIYLLADIATKKPETQPETVSLTERYEEPKTVKKEEPVPVPKPAPKVEPKPAAPVKKETPKPAAPAKEPAKAVEKTPAPAVTTTKPAPQESAKPVSKPAEKKGYNFPAAQNNATLVFVFDDGGQNMSHLEKFVTLPFPVTVAVLPQITYSVEAAARVRSSGNELMLHQPMQPVSSSVNPGPGAITLQMTDEQIITTLFNNINQIGPIAGFNNHEGSAITADAEKMAVVMRFASQEGIYFMDSRTNVETKVPYVAEELGYSYYERNIFLDNEKTRENVLRELNKGLAIANKNGQAIMIGHVWSADFLPVILKEVYPELVSKGYKFALVSNSKKAR